MLRAEANPYTILGVRRGATWREIAHAYRRLARKHHPDMDRDPAAPARMRQINAAWKILRDPVQRALYDAAPAEAPRRPTPPSHWAGVPRRTPQSATWRGWEGRRPVTAVHNPRRVRNDGSFRESGLAGALAALVILLLMFGAVYAGQAAEPAVVAKELGALR
jgi:curved DNA-binding protein CbpA